MGEAMCRRYVGVKYADVIELCGHRVEPKEDYAEWDPEWQRYLLADAFEVDDDEDAEYVYWAWEDADHTYGIVMSCFVDCDDCVTLEGFIDENDIMSVYAAMDNVDECVRDFARRLTNYYKGRGSD